MKPLKTAKPIPSFANEDEERAFWATADTIDYFDIDQPVKLDLTRLRPSTRSITLRLPQALIADLKTLANKKDVPYQSLMKVYLAEKVREERQA